MEKNLAPSLLFRSLQPEAQGLFYA